jgi:hypothetical protein
VDIYHVWFNLKDGVRDTESAGTYLDHLKAEGALAGYRITRRKLGSASARRNGTSPSISRTWRKWTTRLCAPTSPTSAISVQ